MEALPGQ